jgi:exodeoxyribonuclease V alpha subunit
MSSTRSVTPGRCRITGVIESRFDDGRDEGFQAGRVHTGDAAVVFVGEHLPMLRPGVEVELDGHWEVHPEHGRQLRVVKVISYDLPRSPEGVERLLCEVPGFGPAYAKKVVAARGPGVLDELFDDPSILTKIVPGKRGRTLQEGWRRWQVEWQGLRAGAKVAAGLVGAGCSPSQARQVIDFFRSAEAARAVVLRHPYRLLEVPGLGWKRVERIARTLNVPPADPERLVAAAITAAQSHQQRGHSGAPRDALCRATGTLLGDPSLGEQAVDHALESGQLVEDALLYLPQALEAEWSVASQLRRMARRQASSMPDRWGRAEGRTAALALNKQQQAAVRSALTKGLTLLTGGPGTGKTTTTKEIVQAAQALGISVSVIAPTGRAAMRSSEVTGAPAATIHKAIGGPPGSRRDVPIRDGLVVVEEASMVSTETMAWLLENLAPRTRLVLVGDPDQLPSIDHGALLRDLVRSGALPAVELESVYRQGEESGIVAAARKVRDGVAIDGSEGTGFHFVDTSAAPPGSTRDGHARQRLRDAVAWLREKEDPSTLQVLTLMKRRALGTRALNEMLQDLLNPQGEPGPAIGGGAQVRVGDWVIQVRNDYTLGAAGIMNGQQGLVTGVGPGRVQVAFEDEALWIDGFRLYNLRLAWAITVHKSQGSEWDHVVVVADRSHGALLSRQLLYTALTRAKQTAVLIADREALAIASARHTSEERITGLIRHLEVRHG